MTGQRFEKLVVTERGPNSPGGITRWKCVCDCGNSSLVAGTDLRAGRAVSCGCSKTIRGKEHRSHVHGHSRSKTYASWCAAVQRCTNPKNPKWSIYGDRGITVCEHWRTFENFLADMGERPPGTSLDRLDNEKGYQPGNCRWASDWTQQNNRRNAVRYEYQGRSYSMTELAAAVGMPFRALRSRLYRGMSVDDAVSKPLREASLGNVNPSKTKTAKP
jgi:hypothetical protein